MTLPTRVPFGLVAVAVALACAGSGGIQPPGTFADPTDAARHYESVIVNEPENALAHLYLAEARQRLGDGAEAAGHYRTALELDPALTRAYLGLGSLLEEERRFVAAADVYRRMADNDPIAKTIMDKVSMLRDSLEQAEHLVVEARQLLEDGRSATARILFRRAVRIAPFHLEARVGLAEALAACARLSRSYTERKRLLTDAVAEYNQVLFEDELFPGGRDGRERVGSLLDAEESRYARAEKYVDAEFSPFRESLNPDLDLPFISFQNRGGGDLTFELSFEGGTQQLYVAVSKANVRDGPGSGADVIGSLSRGTVVFALDEEVGYTHMTDGNIQGWVATSLLESDVHIVLRLSGHTGREMVLAPGKATCRCSRFGQTIWEGEAEFLPYVSYAWSCE